ncbi:hypothetical protein B0H19DRAFT_1201208 [Mycena capillaripes]|nr:hypothetical protein B0H19DRAFT_1201208 [Mycena capillaripes]
MKLWLPSAIGACAQCDETLQDYEYHLRKGQAVKALMEMCGQLILHTREYHYRDGVQGVKAKTRSGTRTKGIQVRIDEAANEYRVARAALVKLGAVLKHNDWALHFKELKPEDVRGRPAAVFGDDERRKGKKKKTKRVRLDPHEEAERAPKKAEDKLPMSWIWLSTGSIGEAEDVVDNEGKDSRAYHPKFTDVLPALRIRAPGLCGTRRRSTSSRRRCGTSFSSFAGVPNGGDRWWGCGRRDSWKPCGRVVQRMRTNRRRTWTRWWITSRSCGRMFPCSSTARERPTPRCCLSLPRLPANCARRRPHVVCAWRCKIS